MRVHSNFFGGGSFWRSERRFVLVYFRADFITDPARGAGWVPWWVVLKTKDVLFFFSITLSLLYRFPLYVPPTLNQITNQPTWTYIRLNKIDLIPLHDLPRGCCCIHHHVLCSPRLLGPTSSNGKRLQSVPDHGFLRRRDTSEAMVQVQQFQVTPQITHESRRRRII